MTKKQSITGKKEPASIRLTLKKDDVIKVRIDGRGGKGGKLNPSGEDLRLSKIKYLLLALIFLAISR